MMTLQMLRKSRIAALAHALWRRARAEPGTPRGSGRLGQWFSEEAGEVAPASYFFAFLLALIFIFFAIDLGLRKGARVAVEYGAYCAARAAATQLPSSEAEKNEAGACLDQTELDAIEHAASACVASVASKRGVFLSLELPGAISRLIKNTRKEHKIKVRLLDENKREKRCFGHNEVVTAELHYLHTLSFPLSPLSLAAPDGLEMVARASHMVHTIK